MDRILLPSQTPSKSVKFSNVTNVRLIENNKENQVDGCNTDPKESMKNYVQKALNIAIPLKENNANRLNQQANLNGVAGSKASCEIFTGEVTKEELNVVKKLGKRRNTLFIRDSNSSAVVQAERDSQIRDTAASIITGAVKARAARNRFIKMKSAAVLIQSVYRSHRQRSEFLTKRSAAIKIQSLVRMRIQRKSYLSQLQQIKLEKVRLEQERIEKERLEQERLEQERIEKERLEQERLEQERIENERLEQERIAAEKLEQERIAAEKLAEEERIATEKHEQERLAAEKLEQERIAAEKLEQERIAAEKLAEEERIAAEMLEQERIAAEKMEQERIAAEKLAEEERIAAEKLEQERIAAEKLEEERIAAEKLAEERIAAEKMEQERIAAEKLEQERIAAEKLEQERIAAEKLEQERIAAEKLEQERIAAEKLEQERIAAEHARLEQERIVAEEQRLEREREEMEILAAEERVEQERIAAEKLEQERIAAEELAEKERKEREREEMEILAAEQEKERVLEQEQLAQEREEQERIAAIDQEQQEKIDQLEKLNDNELVIEQLESEPVIVASPAAKPDLRSRINLLKNKVASGAASGKPTISSRLMTPTASSELKQKRTIADALSSSTSSSSMQSSTSTKVVNEPSKISKPTLSSTASSKTLEERRKALAEMREKRIGGATSTTTSTVSSIKPTASSSTSIPTRTPSTLTSSTASSLLKRPISSVSSTTESKSTTSGLKAPRQSAIPRPSIVIGISQDEISSVFWVVQQYRIDYNISELACNTNQRGVSLTCDSGGSIFEITFYDAGVKVDHGQPNATINTLIFPKLKSFYMNQQVISLYDPTLNLLDFIKPSGFPLLQYISHRDHNATAIPQHIFQIQFLQQIYLYSRSLTVLPSYVLHPSNGLGSLNLPDSPIVQLDYIPNQNSPIYYLNIGLGMNDTFVTFNSSIIRQSKTFTLTFQVFSKISLTDIAPTIILSGKGSDFGMIDTGGPLNLLPHDLSIYNLTTYTNSNITQFPNFTIKGTVSGQISYLTLSDNKLSGAVPNEYFHSIFKSVNVGDNIGINFLPNDACGIRTVWADDTSLTDLPDCFKCYWGSSGIYEASDFRGTPIYNSFNPSTYKCPITYTKHYLSYDAATITIVGNNLGWAYQNDFDPRLKVLEYNKKFLYNIDLSNRSPHIVLSNSSNVAIDITWEIESIIILDLSISQYPGGLEISTELNLTLGFNQYLNFMIDGVECYPMLPSFMAPPTGVPGVVHYSITCPNPAKGGLKNVSITDPYSTVYTTYNLVLEWPVVTAASPLAVGGGVITLSGTFSGQENTSISIDGRFCNKTMDSTHFVTCFIQGPLLVGYQLLNVSDSGFYFVSKSIVVVLGDPEDNFEYCKKTYANCTGHGECNQDGKCVCFPGSGWFGIKCDQQLAPGPTVNINNTSPSASIDYKGFKFEFSIVSIQEIDELSNVVKEIPMTSNWTIDKITNVDGLSSVYYTFDKNNLAIPYPSLSVQSVLYITNTTTSTDIGFGGETISLAPNSVKISVNVTGWSYQSSLSTLRVVYRSPLSLEQCTNLPISAIHDKDNMTIQYIRVLSSDVEFFGRFTNIAVSDGRPTYSSVVLLNETIEPNTDKSYVLIGINVPKCMECLVDPDFSALVNVDYKEKTCGKKDSNTWKIITGVVVGGVVLIASTVAAAVFYIKKRKFKKDSKKMQAKLKRHSSVNNN
ncbi:hypothetical protein PPL_03778 [Heterostelium album PN500]|uniref:EGF-like domain-containing protein n=1 Tax=Heterostelium pallidum (strain ATCC 26659 / Pp 5 / PN500) TaxID=670386 RepID=D3B6M8_HETP5|nr:hypothetical protein PPL_03778 [Heterostelium album PN500]EFA82998.1 hypothetical protein PPL_03778 [Heterostelium album PN500]|eukprot:XP_020435115.1 hypothetical protein PPL_03778 [Heterostelium album PN500]